jgi:membrane associated rhomboid family serine protease
VPKLRITYNAPVVLTFAVLAALVQCLPDAAKSWFIAYPSFHYGVRSYVGLFTHILGHASWQHLLSNFMLILLIGPILEERHGSLSLLAMILVTALIEGLATVAFYDSSAAGASGVAFMMILLASTANIRSGEVPLTLIAIAALYLGGEVTAMIKNDDHVAHLVHLVGGLAGAGFGFLGAGLVGEKKIAPAIKNDLLAGLADPKRRSPASAGRSDPPRSR